MPKDKQNIKTGDMLEKVPIDVTKKTFTYMGVEFPKYFANPRFMQTKDLNFTLAVDRSQMSREMVANWETEGVKELADLTKKVLVKLTGEDIKSL